MKNNKAFTLAELLAVLVILALIAMISIPAVSDAIEKYRNRTCVIQFDYIIEDAKTWAADNMGSLPDDGEYYDLEISDLITYGYISDDLVNPKNGETFPETWVVRISRNNKTYVYEIYDTDSSKTIDSESYCEG